jgi:hypothetical protein
MRTSRFLIFLALASPAVFFLVRAQKTSAPPADSPAYDAAFWSVWGDGQAELSGYELTQPRYGKLRRGVAVAIFVTETFSNSARVKADPGKHPRSDEFPVMKLNLIKDYQTGIYDYNDMLSAFIALAPLNGRAAGSPTKIAFSSQEWCGQVYSQTLFDSVAARLTSHSYFDGEADQQRQLDYPPGGVSEDTLLLWARGMARPAIAPGESRTVPLLMSLVRSRQSHVPMAWASAALTRSAAPSKVTVPAGSFEVETLSAEIAGGATLAISVEKAAPRRIIAWQSSTGERAALLNSARLKYWQLNTPEGERELKKLGLSPRPPRTT